MQVLHISPDMGRPAAAPALSKNEQSRHKAAARVRVSLLVGRQRPSGQCLAADVVEIAARTWEQRQRG